MSASEIALRQGTDVAVFDPAKTHIKILALDAAIKHAKKIKDWDSLKEAVDEQIAEQAAFVAWWQGAVQDAGGDGSNQHQRAIVSDRGQLLSADEATAQTTIRKQQVSRWKGYIEKDAEAYRKRLFGRAYADAMGVPNGTEGTGIDEWYTPAEYIEAVRKVLGSIELDPASSAIAQKTVKAKRYFSIENDALKQAWKAKTAFMNPPYSAANIFHFVDKLVTELTAGNIGSAIMLTNNYTDTAWFHRAEEIALAICFTRGRIRYVDADGNESAPTNGQTFFYFGDEADTFGEVFRDFGFIR